MQRNYCLRFDLVLTMAIELELGLDLIETQQKPILRAEFTHVYCAQVKFLQRIVRREQET